MDSTVVPVVTISSLVRSFIHSCIVSFLIYCAVCHQSRSLWCMSCWILNWHGGYLEYQNNWVGVFSTDHRPESVQWCTLCDAVKLGIISLISTFIQQLCKSFSVILHFSAPMPLALDQSTDIVWSRTADNCLNKYDSQC